MWVGSNLLVHPPCPYEDTCDEQVPILEENTLNEYDGHNVGSSLLRITGQCISICKSYILQVLRYLMLIIGTLILTDTNKEVYKHVLKQTTRLLIVHLILTPYCYNGQMEMGKWKWAIGSRQMEIDKWKWIKTKLIIMNKEAKHQDAIKRKKDLKKELLTTHGKKSLRMRCELWGKYAA